jgi:hypothetical protein
VITRNALISIVVLMAGLIAGYFAFRLSRELPVFGMQESGFAPLNGEWEAPDSSGQKFFGSSVELSHLYEASKSDFPEVVNRASMAMQDISLRKDMLMGSRDTLAAAPEAIDRQIAQLDDALDVLRLLDYYTRYFMHYYLWLETGHLPASVDYKLAMGQFRAMVEYHRQKYEEHALSLGPNLEALMQGTRVAEQTDRCVRLARVVTVILLFMLLMGIPRFIRDRGTRKFAGTLYFDALFRPNRISDLNAWHSVPRMALALILLYLFGGVILSAFVSWRIPLVLGALGLFPVLFLMLIMGHHRKSAEVLVSLMAPKVLILVLFLGIAAVRGPMFFWYHFWVTPWFRALFLGIFVMFVFHKVRVHSLLARKWSHRNRLGAAAMVGMAMGLQFLVCGIFLGVFGWKESLLVLNRDLVLLPAWTAESPGCSSFMSLTSGLSVSFFLVVGVIFSASLVLFLWNRKGPAH